MTSDEKKKLYAALSAPFPDTAIERTNGRTTGRGYDTTGIKYQYVVNRLNEVLGVGGYRAQRTITIKESSTAKGRPAFDAICEIKLELGEWVSGEFKPFAEALGDGGHTSTSEADARKGSYTNAFKKAAAFVGVGKQAYEGTLDDDNFPPEDAEPAVTQGRGSGSGAVGEAPQPQRNRLSAKQLATIWAIAKDRNLDERAVRNRILQLHNVTPEFLTRAQASEVIGAMSANGDGRHVEEQ